MNEASVMPFALAVSGPAQYTNAGDKIHRKSVKAPYELRFKTPEKIRDRFESTRTKTDWYKEIRAKVNVNENLFDVYVYTPEWNGNPMSEVKIAEVLLKTPLYTSRWADRSLYFKHRHVSMDRKHWSKHLKDIREDPWLDMKDEDNRWGSTVPAGWPKDQVKAEAKYVEEEKLNGCPFAWLLN